MATVNGVEYVVKDLPSGKLTLKASYPMKAKGYTLHNTYNDASAENEIGHMQRNDSSISFHFAVDNKMVIQGLPLNRNGWHAGDGRNGYGNRNTYGVEICYSKSGGERYDKAETNAIKFVAHGLYENGWDVSKVWKHKDWSGKNCPHRILARSRGWEGIIKAIQKELDRLKGKKTNVSKPSPTKPKATSINKKGVEQLAREVMAGKWGHGEERKRRLGNRYAAVQKRVNELLKPSNKKKNVKGVEQLAREVLAGKHGNGDKRKQSLGNMYHAVQKRVNEMSNPRRKKTPVKSLNTLVKEVMAGKHGDGAQRKKSLGKDYDRVQKEINRRYGKK